MLDCSSDLSFKVCGFEESLKTGSSCREDPKWQSQKATLRYTAAELNGQKIFATSRLTA
jgi:hypothetical protein